MAYFNHAFTKIFLGTQSSTPGQPNYNANGNLSDGFITKAGIASVALSETSATAGSNYGPGSYGFFDPTTWLSVDATWFNAPAGPTPGTISAPSQCCPLVLASASLLSKDKLNQYIGGYKESNKSKTINPRYVQKMYRVDSVVPQQSVISIGTTPQTIIPGLPADGFQGGTMQSNCCYNYLCGETYYLRIDIKGSPALRFLNHNAYQTLSAYTGCCPAGAVAPVNVDPTTVYITWAKALVLNNYLKDLVAPVVYDYTGVAWYAPGTTVTYDGTNTPVADTQWWTSPTGVDQYAASVQAGAWVDECTAGMRLFGAYVETKFGNCSFQITDFFEKEPVRLYGSLVDYNGDPCVFEGLCVYNDCLGVQGMGFGEQVVRDLIKAESYLQNFFHTDIRIREITQGNQILDAIDRNALYTRYFILHSVPRFNNPSGTFDNDRYLLEIITQGINTDLEDFLEAWSFNCPACAGLETFGLVGGCELVPDEAAPVPPVPAP
jgi:hypothetical protein